MTLTKKAMGNRWCTISFSSQLPVKFIIYTKKVVVRSFTEILLPTVYPISYKSVSFSLTEITIFLINLRNVFCQLSGKYVFR